MLRLFLIHIIADIVHMKEGGNVSSLFLASDEEGRRKKKVRISIIERWVGVCVCML